VRSRSPYASRHNRHNPTRPTLLSVLAALACGEPPLTPPPSTEQSVSPCVWQGVALASPMPRLAVSEPEYRRLGVGRVLPGNVDL
jgi:hypothetical protein